MYVFTFRGGFGLVLYGSSITQHQIIDSVLCFYVNKLKGHASFNITRYGYALEISLWGDL